jgi:hypothetical protein
MECHVRQDELNGKEDKLIGLTKKKRCEEEKKPLKSKKN